MNAGCFERTVLES